MSRTNLFHFRWSVPVLAELHRSGAAKFVTLSERLGVGRETLRRTLEALIDTGLVLRNPGYGHPLRPEYVLSQRGERVAPACAALLDALRQNDLEDLGLKKWSIPVVVALASERRFTELRELLRVTPRALALSLKELAQAGLIERRIHDGFPPTTSYRLTPQAQPLRRAAERLC